jgi:hypothetical protein
VAWARQAIHGRMTMVPGQGLEVVEAHRIVALADGWTGPTLTTEVQALVIGDPSPRSLRSGQVPSADAADAADAGQALAIVGLPGEVFAELGLDLRARSPFAHTLVLGLANEAIGYVPTRRACDEGGYEPTSSRLEPGGGELLVEAALELLGQLSRQ